MNPKLYLTDSAQNGIDSNKKYKWTHLYAGAPVPPTKGGSFNFLIDDLIKGNQDHILISRFYKESFDNSKLSDRSIASPGLNNHPVTLFIIISGPPP